MNRPLGAVTPGEAGGLAIYTTAAALWLTLIITAMTGTIDDLIAWVFGPGFLRTVGVWAAVAGVVVLLGWAARRGGLVGAHGHVHRIADGSDRGRDALQKHEDAHQRVGARVGAGGSTVRIWPDGGGWAGVTRWHDPGKYAALPPEKQIAIDVAGIMAAPSTDSPTDMPHARAVARGAPNPGKAMREGRRIARRYI